MVRFRVWVRFIVTVKYKIIPKIKHDQVQVRWSNAQDLRAGHIGIDAIFSLVISSEDKVFKANF